MSNKYENIISKGRTIKIELTSIPLI